MGISSSNSASAPRPSPPSLCSATSVEHGGQRRQGDQSSALRSIGKGYQERNVPVLGDLVLERDGCAGFNHPSLLGQLGYTAADAICGPQAHVADTSGTLAKWPIPTTTEPLANGWALPRAFWSA